MWYVVASLIGMVGGALCVYLAPLAQRRRLDALKRELDAKADRVREAERSLQSRDERNLKAVAAKQQELGLLAAQLKRDHNLRMQVLRDQDERNLKAVAARQQELELMAADLKRARAQFDGQVVSYRELRDENAILKRDLLNLHVNVKKLRLDGQARDERQDEIDLKCRNLADRHLKDQVKWVGSSLTANNFAACKQRLQKAIDGCREVGVDIPKGDEESLLSDLRADYEKVVRAALEREEQARIKAQIREEQLREREVERELQRLDRERAAIQAALEKALAEAKDVHSAQIEELRARLADAEARAERTKSQAELTKSGHVYVISNIGSFGDGVFKIGMTRRLEPLDRIRELGDASVPFPFDVHMMIASGDAPTLENALHRELHRLRVNKANPRKEFFRTDFDAIRRIVESNHGEVEYLADAEALEYRQSIAMPDEDMEFIEDVYDKLSDDGEASDGEV